MGLTQKKKQIGLFLISREERRKAYSLNGDIRIRNTVSHTLIVIAKQNFIQNLAYIYVTFSSKAADF
jgi:hypothetical protein